MTGILVTSHTHLIDGLVPRLHADIEALLAVAIVRLGQDVVDMVKDVALVQELMVGLLKLEAPAPEMRVRTPVKTKQHTKQ